MVNVADVRRWNAGQLGEIAHAIQQREQTLIHSGDDFAKMIPVDGWSGPAAQNAASAHRSLKSTVNKMAAGVSVVSKAVMQASDAIPGVQHAVNNAEELARKYGYQVGDDGAITDTFAGGAPPPEMHPDDRERAKVQAADAIGQALRTAGDIDRDLTSVIQRADRGEFGTGDEPTVAAAAAAGAADPGLTLLEPPQNGTASQNAAWWASLSPAGQAILLRDHPYMLGNMDGLPGAARTAANAARIPGERTALKRQLDRAREHTENVKDMVWPPPNALGDALARERALKAKLNSLDSIESTMAQGDRQLLTLDTSGERVKAAVAVGNVDTAKHVSVFVPGFNSTVDGSLDGYDRDMDNLRGRTQAIADMHGDGGETANVTWIGYETPQNEDILHPSESVGSDDLAQQGAPKLNGFVNGLNASHEVSGQPLHLTALGHSYGSLTTGIALQESTPVDDAVVFGSPGMNIDNVHDLNVPEGHTYSLRADQDPVPDLNIGEHFGKSPYDLPGIDRMATGEAVAADGTPLHATHKHSEYLDDQSSSQYNMAAVAAGRPDMGVDYGQPPSGPR